MKSKITLNPAIKKVCHDYIDQGMAIERAYIAQLCVTAGALALNRLYGWKGAAQDWAAETYTIMEAYFDADPNVWPDMAEADCKAAGLEFDGDWVKARDRQPLKVTKEQQEYLEESRKLMVPQELIKKTYHEGWKKKW